MLPEDLHADVRTLWDYHDLRHEPRRSDVGIGLGSRDPGVAVHTAELFHAGRFPLVVFTGPNAPTTVERFPRGAASWSRGRPGRGGAGVRPAGRGGVHATHAHRPWQ